jgi:hypothetical protein
MKLKIFLLAWATAAGNGAPYGIATNKKYYYEHKLNVNRKNRERYQINRKSIFLYGQKPEVKLRKKLLKK